MCTHLRQGIRLSRSKNKHVVAFEKQRPEFKCCCKAPMEHGIYFFSLKKGEAARDLVMLRVPRVQTEIQV